MGTDRSQKGLNLENSDLDIGSVGHRRGAKTGVLGEETPDLP